MLGLAHAGSRLVHLHLLSGPDTVHKLRVIIIIQNASSVCNISRSQCCVPVTRKHDGMRAALSPAMKLRQASLASVLKR